MVKHRGPSPREQRLLQNVLTTSREPVREERDPMLGWERIAGGLYTQESPSVEYLQKNK